VKADHGSHVLLEPARIVGETVGEAVGASQISFAPTDLFAEVAAPGGEKIVKRTPRDREHWTCGAAQRSPAELCDEAVLGRQTFAQEHAAAAEHVRNVPPHRFGGERSVRSRAHWAELVTGPGSDQSSDLERTLTVEIQRQYGDHAPVRGTSDPDGELSVAPDRPIP
jgi:hypothetical protein